MTAAYEQGYNARCSGFSRRANPYHKPQQEYYDWVSGWEAAEEDSRKYP